MLVKRNELTIQYLHLLLPLSDLIVLPWYFLLNLHEFFTFFAVPLIHFFILDLSLGLTLHFPRLVFEVRDMHEAHSGKSRHIPTTQISQNRINSLCPLINLNAPEPCLNARVPSILRISQKQKAANTITNASRANHLESITPSLASNQAMTLLIRHNPVQDDDVD